MTTTIDAAGRIVVPKKLRDAFHLRGGTAIEIVADGEGLRIRVPQTEHCFVEKDGILVQRADVVADVDSTAFLNQQLDAHAVQFFSGLGMK
jgi:AbrB family looped-hinge helix DNA binding protein